MTWRNMGTNSTILWILWSTIWPVRAMLNSIVGTILPVLHCHVHLVLYVIFATICSHLALVSHMVTTTGWVRSLGNWRRWRDVLSIAYFAVGISTTTIFLCVSMLSLSYRPTWLHLSISRLLTSTWNLILCIFVPILHSICSFYIFYILLDIGLMGNGL